MSTVNFNDTVPAPPANFTNLKWQSDASGNISAYDPGGTWTNWTPTLTTQGSITATLKTITDARYLRQGPVVYLKLHCTATISGGTDGYLKFSLPVTLVGNACVATGVLIAATTSWIFSYGDPVSNTLIFNSQTYTIGDNDVLAFLTYSAT